MLNRSAVFLAPRKPYIDWANAVDRTGQHFVENWQHEGATIFLVPDFQTHEEIRAHVDQNFELIFEHYLDLWCEDQNKWPRPRTLEMFHQWFSVRIHTMIIDTVGEPIRFI